ncbi:uncharacterized protein [Epargyreus clarus]|uniref:uncharacterized protein n=1 Tax=Epargyreus clarus TaxID=520877 RepID=UPI003C2DBB45
MASSWVWMVVGVLLGSVLEPALGDAEVMSHVTAHFGKALEECREESGLSADVMEGFQHFWSEDFEVVHRELGCAIICMSNKFSLMQDDARMHHVNMHDYVKSFPKGEILSAKMVELIHNCEKQFDDIEEDCSRVVKVAACFKRDAKKEGIAPEVTMIEAVMEKYMTITTTPIKHKAYIKMNSKIIQINISEPLLKNMKSIMIFLLMVYLLLDREADSSQEVVKTMTITFTKALDECKKEMALPSTINTDFFNLWKEDYELSDPMTGCAVICLSKKINIVDPDGKVRIDNTQEFAKEQGADDEMAQQFVDLLHQCEITTPPSDDDCVKVLGITKCFKAEIHKLNWAPDMAVIMEEILAEV